MTDGKESGGNMRAETSSKSEPKRPKVKLIGEDGNVFNLMAIARKALIKAGQESQAKEMVEKIQTEARDYYDALGIIQQYVDAY